MMRRRPADLNPARDSAVVPAAAADDDGAKDKAREARKGGRGWCTGGFLVLLLVVVTSAAVLGRGTALLFLTWWSDGATSTSTPSTRTAPPFTTRSEERQDSGNEKQGSLRSGIVSAAKDPPEFDPNGYEVSCLGMGRYGNQMEQLLGGLAQSKSRGRTFVLPPFISFRPPQRGVERGIDLIPLEDIFDLSEIGKFHRVVTMEDFMTNVAPVKWAAKEGRTVYCLPVMKQHGGCKAKDGSPFGPYWDHYGVNFTQDQFVSDWGGLKPEEHYVVATKAVMASYPMRPEHRYVAKYFKWNDRMEERARRLMDGLGLIGGKKDNGDDVVIVAAHIRAGRDWVSACEHAIGRREYMASPQCSEQMKASGVKTVTRDVCLPAGNMTGLAETLRGAGELVRRIKEGEDSSNKGSKSTTVVLYVASDVPTLGKELMETYRLNETYARLAQQQDWKPSSTDAGDDDPSSIYPAGNKNMEPFLDLAVMTKADYFVGTCTSSFTSFAYRMRVEREVGMGSGFFGF